MPLMVLRLLLPDAVAVDQWQPSAMAQYRMLLVAGAALDQMPPSGAGTALDQLLLVAGAALVQMLPLGVGAAQHWLPGLNLPNRPP
jgi:hypothetical protein